MLRVSARSLRVRLTGSFTVNTTVASGTGSPWDAAGPLAHTAGPVTGRRDTGGPVRAEPPGAGS